MAVKRFRPTSTSTSGTIYRIEKATTTAGYDPEVAVYGYDACAFYGTNSVTLNYSEITDIPTNTISNINIVYRACSSTGGSRGGAIQLLNNDTGISAVTIDLIQYGSSTDPYLHDPANCTTYNVPSGAWDLILNGNWSIRVLGRGSNNTLFTIICVDIEYEEPTDFRIGANQLTKAFLGTTNIQRIYKGNFLLFEDDTFTPLRYIQGTGTQYIDTGIKMNSSVNIEADAEIRQFAWQRDNAPTDLAGIFGNISCGDSGGNRAGLRFYTQRNYYWYYSNTGWPTVWPTDETFYSRNIYKNVGNVFYINGTSTITGTTGSWSGATNNALLFSMGENPKAGMKLYGAKLYDNGTLVRDFIPARRNRDQAVGLYDNVSKTFFTNAGTGVFYESIPDEYQEVEYIQSNGNGHNTGQHIDTGYFPTDGDVFRVNMTVMPLSVPNTEREYLAKYGNGGTNIQIGHLSSGSWNMGNTDTQFRYTQSSPSNAVNNKTYIDGEITISGTSSISLYLFAQNESPGNTNSVWDSSIRLYACTIAVNGEVIRNYVPCYRKSDGVIGLYDTINKQFKINEGTGSFTKGSDVN